MRESVRLEVFDGEWTDTLLFVLSQSYRPLLFLRSLTCEVPGKILPPFSLWLEFSFQGTVVVAVVVIAVVVVVAEIVQEQQHLFVPVAEQVA